MKKKKKLDSSLFPPLTFLPFFFGSPLKKKAFRRHGSQVRHAFFPECALPYSASREHAREAKRRLSDGRGPSERVFLFPRRRRSERRRRLLPRHRRSFVAFALLPGALSFALRVCSPSGTRRSRLECRRWERLSLSRSALSPADVFQREAMSFPDLKATISRQSKRVVLVSPSPNRSSSLVRPCCRSSFALRVKNVVVCRDDAVCWSQQIPATDPDAAFFSASLSSTARVATAAAAAAPRLPLLLTSLFLSSLLLPLPLNQPTGRKPASSRA